MNPRGHVLLETLVGVALAAGIAAALVAFAALEQRRLGVETRRAAALQELQAALDLVAADLRAAGRIRTKETGGAVPLAGFCLKESERLRLLADLDGDGSTLGPGEDVTYCRCPDTAGSPLYRAWRASAGGSFVVEPVLSPVSGLAFRYGPRSVEVELRVAEEAALGGVAEEVRTTAVLRNSPATVGCGPGPVCPPPEGCR
jgi:type II secretory pathway pseudopilin PulG